MQFINLHFYGCAIRGIIASALKQLVFVLCSSCVESIYHPFIVYLSDPLSLVTIILCITYF